MILTEKDIKAMDDMGVWAEKHIVRPRQVAPDAKIEARYGALQQSLAHYRAARPAPFSRADKIILAAQAEASEIGALRGEVRRLCDEIAALSNPEVAPAAAKCGETWGYVDVQAGEELDGALVRCFYDADIEIDLGLDLRAVYLAGVDITQGLCSSVTEALQTAARDEYALTAEEDNINAAIFRSKA